MIAKSEIRAEAERQIIAAIAAVRAELPGSIPETAEAMVRLTLRVK